MTKVLQWINEFGAKYNGILTIAGLAVPLVSWIVARAAGDQTWVSNHKAWFVWGGLSLGALILSFALLFFCRSTFLEEWLAERRRAKIKKISRGLKSLGELQSVQGLKYNQQTLAKEKVPVCIVDDRNAAVIRRELNQFGYKNISTRKDLPSDEELLKYAILILDVDGVGTKRNSNGLSFAMNFKSQHPLKQIIMVSGYFSDPRYEADVERAQGWLDGFFTRSDSYDANMKPLLSKCLDILMDPSAIWRIVQKALIHEQVANDGKVFIKLLEDEYVREVLFICRENAGELPHDWIQRLFARSKRVELLDVLRRYGLIWLQDEIA